jgi:hypothetical protein
VTALAECGPAANAAGSTEANPTLANDLREAWRRGDWAALAEVTNEQLASQPEPARLQLLRAAARMALGEGEGARADATAARLNGCDRGLLRRALVASIHNTLARAAAANPTLRGRSAHHFREALQPAGSSPLRGRWLETRVRQQLELIGLSRDAEPLLAAVQASQPVPAIPWKALQDSMQQGQAACTTQIKALGEQLAKAERGLDKTVRQHVTNAVSQLEAHSRLQSYLAGQPTVPQLHGWPVSPDFAWLMVELIETNNYDAVIEFGSGASTVLIAHALDRVVHRRRSRGLHLAFEHLPQYHEQTAGLLRAAGLREAVRLELAPLVPRILLGGDTRRCYAGDAAMQVLARDLALANNNAPRVLIVVDGPPASTGPKARYPVLELVHAHLPDFQGEVLLDDYARPDEQAVAAGWCDYLAACGVEHRLRAVDLEKAACVVSVQRAPR